MAKIRIGESFFEGSKIEVKEGEVLVDDDRKGIIFGEVRAEVIEGKESYEDGNLVVVD